MAAIKIYFIWFDFFGFMFILDGDKEKGKMEKGIPSV